MQSRKRDIDSIDQKDVVVFTGTCVAVAGRTKEGLAFRIKFRVSTGYLKKTDGGKKIFKRADKKKKKSKDDMECEEGEESEAEEDEEQEEDLFSDDEQETEKLSMVIVSVPEEKKTEPKPDEKKAKEKFKDFSVEGFDCNSIKSPLLTSTLKLVPKRGNGKEIAYELIDILKIQSPKFFTVNQLKIKARASLMFDHFQKPTIRNKMIGKIFDVLGEPSTEIRASKQLRCLIANSVHKDIVDFCHNALRIEKVYEIGMKTGWQLPSVMEDDEIEKLMLSRKSEKVKILQKVLCDRMINKKNIVFDRRAMEYFAAEDKELLVELGWLCKANEIIRRMQYNQTVKYDSCMKTSIGAGQYQIEPETLECLEQFEKRVFIDRDYGDKLTLKLQETYQQELLFCRSFAFVPLVHLIDVECDTNFKNINPGSYFAGLQKLEASATKTIWFTSKSRMHYLKSEVGSTTELSEFKSFFPLYGEDSLSHAVQRMEMKFKHNTPTAIVILEQSHILSTVEFSFFLRVITAVWQKLRIKKLILCGNRYCFPESPGHPFTDLVTTFNDHSMLTTVRGSDGDDRLPERFFDTIEEAAAVIQMDYKKESFDFIVATEDELQKLKKDTEKFDNTIDFQLYSGMRYAKGCNKYMILDVRDKQNITMVQLQKALACAPIKQTNLFVLGPSMNFISIMGDVLVKKGNSRWTDMGFMLVTARQDYEQSIKDSID